MELTPSPVTGVTARVTLPAAVLAAPAAVTNHPHGPATNGVRLGTGNGGPRAIDGVVSPVVEYVTVGGHAVTVTAEPSHSGPPADVRMPQASAGATSGAGANGGAGTNGGGPGSGAVPGESGYRGGGLRDDIAAQVAHGRGERTRNGLLKRVPRQRRTAGPEVPTEPIGEETSPAEAAAEVRSD